MPACRGPRESDEGRTPVTIPNFISIARLLLVPLAIWLIVSDDPVTAFWIFVIAGVSDGVDGFLARQFNMRSDLGGYLDPLADKALLVSIYVTFAILGDIPVWVTILVVSRDVLIVGGVLLAWVVGQPIEMHPRAVSKANTVAQIVLAGIVLGDLAFPIDLAVFRRTMVVVVGLLTVASMLVYVVDWLRHMGTGDESAGGGGERTR
jgi:cardiolipin synthase